MDARKSNPPLARRRSELTRLTILRTARELYRERGYAATTARALAERAGVAVQTIYSTFGSMGQVALALLELATEESGIGELTERVRTVRDPVEAIQIIVRIRRRLREGAGDTIATLRSGAAVEPALRAAWDEGRRQRHGGQRLLMQRIEQAGALAEGLDAARAAAIAAALTSDEVADALVDGGGWSYDEYEAWLTNLLCDLLLAGDTPAGVEGEGPAEPPGP